MRPLLAAIILLGAAAPACRAQPAADLRVPSPDEMEALATNCRENQIVRAGTVVADGEIFEAPLLVTTDKDRILIDGVQVVPRPPRDQNFKAQEISGRLHAQYYLDEKRKIPDASARIEERLNEYKSLGIVDDFKVYKHRGKLAGLQVQAGGGQARVYLDSLPLPLMRKYQFIVAALIGEYRLKAESAGKEQALPWLKARFEELKASGKIEELGWALEREAATIRFPGENAARDYPFGEDQTPFGLAYANRWKARRKQTAAAVQSIVARLNGGGILIYSGSFEKARPADAAVVRALLALAQGRDAASNMARARESLSLTEEQARALAEELR